MSTTTPTRADGLAVVTINGTELTDWQVLSVEVALRSCLDKMRDAMDEPERPGPDLRIVRIYAAHLLEVLDLLRASNVLARRS